MINEAFLFSLNIHKEQFRKDGAPYISHPVETALILAQNGADDLLICAGLLHPYREYEGDNGLFRYGTCVAGGLCGGNRLDSV